MPGYIGNYQTIRTLGSGASCKVKLGIHKNTGRKVALKVMNENMDEATRILVTTEVEALKNINQHINVIQIIECGKGNYIKDSGKKRHVTYIVLEIAQGGELFDFIALSGNFSEPMARHFFTEFMNGLDHCHRQGIAHRDLKPENLMLDSSFNLKIADFGFAAPVEGRDGQGLLHTTLGTPNYMAPEIHMKLPYDARSIDIFAAGIILFIMVAQHPPFYSADPDQKDPFYKPIAANRADIFWKTHTKNKPSEYMSEDIRDLIIAMLQLDPQHRPTMGEILSHPWMKGEIPTKAEVVHEFRQRQKVVDDQLRQEREAKMKEKETIYNTSKQGQIYKSDPTKFLNDDIPPKKKLQKYQKIFEQNTEFFTTFNPDVIEEYIQTYLKDQDAFVPDSLNINKDKYKIKFTMQAKMGEEQFLDETVMQLRILEVQDKQYCVEFTKIGGRWQSFNDYFLKMKKEMDKMNDSVIQTEETKANE